jgi:hypothetical protein
MVSSGFPGEDIIVPLKRDQHHVNVPAIVSFWDFSLSAFAIILIIL